MSHATKAPNRLGAPKPHTFTVMGLSSFAGVTVNDQPAERLIPRDVAAHVAGVKPDTVKHWTNRGWVDKTTGQRRYLEVAKRDWRGRPLYRFRDVMAAEAATDRAGRKRDSQKWAALDINSSGMAHAG